MIAQRLVVWLNTGDNSILAMGVVVAPLLAIVLIGLFGGGA